MISPNISCILDIQETQTSANIHMKRLYADILPNAISIHGRGGRGEEKNEKKKNKIIRRRTADHDVKKCSALWTITFNKDYRSNAIINMILY